MKVLPVKVKRLPSRSWIRSIAATSVNDGYLTPATEYLGNYTKYNYQYNAKIYELSADCYKNANPDEVIIKGPV